MAFVGGQWLVGTLQMVGKHRGRQGGDADATGLLDTVNGEMSGTLMNWLFRGPSRLRNAISVVSV